MKIARFDYVGFPWSGIVDRKWVYPCSGLPMEDASSSQDRYSMDEVQLLAPVNPPDVIAIGLNYKGHADELGNKYPSAPVVFLKSTSSVIGPGDNIVLPAMAPTEVDYEAELAIVIERTCRKVSVEDALDYVLGYTCGNDVSARDAQLKQDVQWARGKSFDTFCPLGPWIETDLNPDNLNISTRVNGQTMQSSNTSDMIFSCAELVSYCSHVMTLRPWTVILTGTPSGVGVGRKPQFFLKPGDRVEVEIEGIGVLENTVVADSSE